MLTQNRERSQNPSEFQQTSGGHVANTPDVLCSTNRQRGHPTRVSMETPSRAAHTPTDRFLVVARLTRLESGSEMTSLEQLFAAPEGCAVELLLNYRRFML